MNCQSCRYYHAMEPPTDAFDGRGQCRRHAPVATKHGDPWATVQHADWCGEYAKVGPVDMGLCRGAAS